jgi:hypothetical protein
LQEQGCKGIISRKMSQGEMGRAGIMINTPKNVLRENDPEKGLAWQAFEKNFSSVGD